MHRAGDSDGAAWTLRSYAALVNEAQVIAGAPTQQQQAPQPQGQQQFTQAEMEWLRGHENIVRDPRKWNECLAAANSLAARGYDRNSPEYINAIELAIGLTGPDGKDGPEMITPEVVSEISRSKYGKVSLEEIQQGQQRLAELKKYGLYPMGQT